MTCTARNISVVGRDTSDSGRRTPEVQVAPIYDIPSTLPYGDHEMALTVRGHLALTRRRLLTFAADIGLPQSAAERALDTTLAVAGQTVDDIRGGESPWAGKARNDLIRGLQHRAAQLSD